jgi:hypothetical protein
MGRHGLQDLHRRQINSIEFQGGLGVTVHEKRGERGRALHQNSTPTTSPGTTFIIHSLYPFHILS